LIQGVTYQPLRTPWPARTTGLKGPTITRLENSANLAAIVGIFVVAVPPRPTHRCAELLFLSDEALLFFRRGFTQDAALLSNPNHAITSAIFYSAFQRGEDITLRAAK
jgi:hypothetical protein